MITNKYGQNVYKSNDVFNVLMRHDSSPHPGPFLMDDADFNIPASNELLGYEAFIDYTATGQTIADFDRKHQKDWFMPDEYKELDIAKHVLDLCDNQVELQRCGKELLMYQERELFNLLRYLTYFVDIMTKNDIIWGVGRGSSVASFVLYKLRVHKVDSIYYQLDVEEFLR